MDRSNTGVFKNQTNLTHQVGNNLPLPAIAEAYPGSVCNLLQLNDIQNGQRLNLEQLEMLEAELRNQGILPQYHSHVTLSQHAFHEASVWRWRARRLGYRELTLNFEISLPEYILQRGISVVAVLDNCDTQEQPWALGQRDRQGVLQELFYLDQFAAFVVGKFEETKNKFEKGLNLVLRALSVPADSSTFHSGRAALTIELPTTHEQFIEKLADQPKDLCSELERIK